MNRHETDSETVREFYDRHCATLGGVVVVLLYHPDGEGEDMGIFSSLDFAKEWIAAHPERTSAAIVPYMIDNPDYGCISRQDLN